VADVRDNPELERFEVLVDGAPAGFTQYRQRPNLIAFVHTEIDPSFEGQGLGSKLVGAALDSARERGLSVMPHCSFVKRYIERHPEYLDLVPEHYRAEFDLA
jgi:predicted GNAT family acetyltransferase